MEGNRTVLIVDPDPESRARAAELAGTAPSTVVVEASYGSGALALAFETRPDVVLAAVEEPVAKALRALGEIAAALPDTPIVAYSHSNDAQTRRRIEQSEACDLLLQPFAEDELWAALNRATQPEIPEEEAADLAGTDTGSPGKVVTVFGAKGGIGKSTIATNLAAAIAQETDLSVLIIDLDTRFGDVSIMLDVEPTYTIADLARVVGPLQAAQFQRALLTHDSGAQVLAAPKHPGHWALVTPEQIQRIVRFAAQQFDYVILDTPGTFTDIVAMTLEVADRVLVVSGLDTTSIEDTARLFDLLDADAFPPDRLRLVINQIHRVTTVEPGDVSRIVEQSIFWAIPYDAEVPRSNSIGVPVVIAKPKSRAATQLQGLMHKLIQREAPQTSSGRWREIVSFLMPWTGRRRPAA